MPDELRTLAECERELDNLIGNGDVAKLVDQQGKLDACRTLARILENAPRLHLIWWVALLIVRIAAPTKGRVDV